jgi:hypothetical protein
MRRVARSAETKTTDSAVAEKGENCVWNSRTIRLILGYCCMYVV